MQDGLLSFHIRPQSTTISQKSALPDSFVFDLKQVGTRIRYRHNEASRIQQPKGINQQFFVTNSGLTFVFSLQDLIVENDDDDDDGAHLSVVLLLLLLLNSNQYWLVCCS